MPTAAARMRCTRASSSQQSPPARRAPAEAAGYVAFGNTADSLRQDIKGAPATRTAAAVPGAYRYPLRQGHSVTMIIHEIDGGFGPDAVKLLNTMANKHGNNRLGAEALVAPWCARSFKTRYAMRISIAIHSLRRGGRNSGDG